MTIASFSSGIPAFVKQLAVLRVKPFVKQMDFMLVNENCSSVGSLSKGNLLTVFGASSRRINSGNSFIYDGSTYINGV
jgi:hypothetical protein